MKKKMLLKSLSAILATCLFFGAIPYAAADDVPLELATQSVSDEFAPLDYSARRSKDEPLMEEATISVADSISLETDFAPNQIIVTLKHKNSHVNADVKQAWFAGMGVAEIWDLTAMEETRSSNSVFGMSIDTLHI